jgi:hypothetical protein
MSYQISFTANVEGIDQIEFYVIVDCDGFDNAGTIAEERSPEKYEMIEFRGGKKLENVTLEDVQPFSIDYVDKE